jgi:2-haloacid dehalogenase
MSEIDFTAVDALTFDCYGTLIDWESGILNAMQPVLAWHAIDTGEQELLEAYARHEASLEGGDYLSYRDVLARALRRLCEELGITSTEAQEAEFGQAVGAWPAFSDSAAALRRLARRFRLGVITNCDDDLFALSNRRLGVGFEWIITAQQARSYKPNPANFELALARIGLPRRRIVHGAQSLYHDHVPARQLGLATVWIDRRGDKPGFGATPAALASPDLTVPDMATFADQALGG